MQYVKLRWQPDDAPEETVYVYGADEALLKLLDEAVDTTDGNDALLINRVAIRPGEGTEARVFRAHRIRGYEVVR